MTTNGRGLGRDAPTGGSEGSGVVAVAGEALIDLVPAGREGLFEAAPGGSPANVAVGLARLGVPVRLLARIAADPLGRRIRAHLTGNGVDLSWAVKAGEPTSLAIVTVGPDGSPEYDFRVEGTADWQWRDAELVGSLDEGVVALHGGSLAFTMPPGADVLARLFERARDTATVSYDPNCRPLLMGAPEVVRDRIQALVTRADVVRSAPRTSPGCCPVERPSRSPRRGSPRGPRSSRSPSVLAASSRRRARRRRCAVPDAGSRSSTPSAPATPS